MKQFLPFFLALVAGLISLSAAPAKAATPWGGRDEGQLRLIVGESTSATGDHLVGVEMQLQEGWHTYWRVPGDSGIAPQFDWSASRNVAAIEMKWPAPERFEAPGDNTYGYAGHVIWPLRVTPLDPAKPLDIRLSLFYGICSNICVPAKVELALEINPNDVAAPEETTLLAEALTRLPVELIPNVATSKLHIWWAPGDPSLLMIEKVDNEAGTTELTLHVPDDVRAGYVDDAEEEGRHVFIMPIEADNVDALPKAPLTLTFTSVGKSEDVAITLP